MLLGEYGNYSESTRRDLNLVTQPGGEGNWGIEFEENMLCDDQEYRLNENDPDNGVDYPLIRRTISHPATNGVGSFYFAWGTSLSVDPSIATVLATSGSRESSSWRDTNYVYQSDINEFSCTWDDSEPRGSFPAMAAVQPGQGRVIAIGDSSMWFNRAFALNLVGTSNLAQSVFTFLSGQ